MGLTGEAGYGISTLHLKEEGSTTPQITRQSLELLTEKCVIWHPLCFKSEISASIASLLVSRPALTEQLLAAAL